MKVTLTPEEVEELLSDLCVKHGICLSDGMIRRLKNNAPTDSVRFAQVVYLAEGLDPKLESDVYKEVLARVERAFYLHPE